MITKITLQGGKYEYILEDDYSSSVYRHDELWKDTTGDNFTLAMAQRIEELEGELDKVYSALGHLPVDIDELIGE